MIGSQTWWRVWAKDNSSQQEKCMPRPWFGDSFLTYSPNCIVVWFQLDKWKVSGSRWTYSGKQKPHPAGPQGQDKEFGFNSSYNEKPLEGFKWGMTWYDYHMMWLYIWCDCIFEKDHLGCEGDRFVGVGWEGNQSDQLRSYCYSPEEISWNRKMAVEKK